MICPECKREYPDDYTGCLICNRELAVESRIKTGINEKKPYTGDGKDANETAASSYRELDKQFKNGANWFYWISGLSIINAIVLTAGFDWSFVVGLGFTQMTAYLAIEFGKQAQLISLVLTLGITGIFSLFGYFARKRKNWAFITGMILYILDGLFFLVLGDWLSFGFHLFALFGIFSGFRALLRLKKDFD